MNNSISQLHEYCTKYNISKPVTIYTSSGPDNSKTWICQLFVSEYSVTSKPCTTKKMALLECSEQILVIIKNRKIKKSYFTEQILNTNSKQIIVLVDLENKNITDFRENFLYIGFIKKTDPKNIKLSEEWVICNNFINFTGPGKLLYCVEGSNKELVDHFMTSFIIVIADILQKNRELMFDIYFLTSDNSSYCSKICYQTYFDMLNITNYKLSNIIHQKYINL